MTTTAMRSEKRSRDSFWTSPGVILVLGVLVVPILIVVTTTNYGVAPTSSDYIRMAFVVVAAATISISTALVVLVVGIVRRSKATSITSFVIVFVFTVSLGLSSINTQMDQLLRVI